MLKALELIGFKSFPDKTRFDFPPGITVVVGPNGSGKSNVVDAMKWVLGEQSARSLRGKEMADVIFKGSAQGKRKPANTAQVTIIFDNSSRLLPLDEAEVHVTRRVYRSGEGEYLINGQTCRLRDVRDLFRGTGVGTDAYSLIEQGKVDSLLQASPRDRRAIFEEAAGISRFKAKKVDAERRLERVDQNLLRLSDIVDEVETRLKRLRSQASKAQRYKEHTDRLQSLRTHVGRVDWQRLTEQLRVSDAQLLQLSEQIVAGKSDLDSLESELAANEFQFTEAEQALHEVEARAGRAREQIAGSRSTVAQQKAASTDLDDEIRRSRTRLADIHSKASELLTQLRELQSSHQTAEDACKHQREELQQRRTALDATTTQVLSTKQHSERRRSEFVEKMRVAADVGNRITAFESQLTSLAATIERCTNVAEEVGARHAAATTELNECSAQADKERQALASINHRIDELASQTEAKSAVIDAAIGHMSELREQQTGLNARATVLREFEDRMEGVGSGVRQVLESARAGEPLYVGVRGMVADIVRVTDADKAAMIDIALGERAQHLIVAGQQLFDVLERDEVEFPGRVGFLRLQSTPPPSSAGWVNLDGQSGVIGRADGFVTTSTEYEHLVSWLLRDTWLVESLADAIQYHRSVSAPIRMVTRRGELLDRDGRLVVGPHDSGIGIISRRAELGDIQEHIERLDQEIAARCNELDGQKEQLSQRQSELNSLITAKQELAGRLAKLELQVSAAVERTTQFQLEMKRSDDDLQLANSQLEGAQQNLTIGRDELSLLETAIRVLEDALSGDRLSLQQLEEKSQSCQEEVTQWEVVVAKSEQRVDALAMQCQQLESEYQERETEIQAACDEVNRNQRRLQEAELRILNAEAEIAEQALVEQSSEDQIGGIAQRRESLKAQKMSMAQEVTRLRNHVSGAEQQRHQAQLESERVKHQRETLFSRLEEDYSVSVAELEVSLTEDESLQREEIDREIDELRRKISNLGAVNMDALEDLTDIDNRYQTLSTQYNDLVESKESLQKIIAKINADSRRLFTETLEAVRANFSVLFRKVFGGGKADIVLEEGVDILESGIDLVATPPGKHSLNLSLLSGGERALTAVALLLAIFQYRPSPFCVLDEVDGPLDEANIGRFIDVLKELLQWTKFVVVTHSKRTMTAAHTLYGITMQESGVSKRVSVRFEDVGEDGAISDDAVSRSANSNPPDDERGAA